MRKESSKEEAKCQKEVSKVQTFEESPGKKTVMNKCGNNKSDKLHLGLNANTIRCAFDCKILLI
jgi:hypothetical protein